MASHKRASAYVTKIPPRGEPWKANFKIAIILTRGLLLQPQEAFDMLRLEFNPRCKPRLSHPELQKLMQKALQAEDRRPRGWLFRLG